MIFCLAARPFSDCFGRRQAIATSERNASGPLYICVLCGGEAPLRGAECFDTMNCASATSFSIPEILPPAGTRSLQVQRAGFWSCGCPARGGGAVRGADCFDARYCVPAACFALSSFWPPAGKWHLQAHWAVYPPPVRLLRRGGAAKRRRML
ncbi:hypothetical protein C8R47DRAFT_1131239 [Mycena vitilis]|nr:hypothetical protein C8R47DRAFT_1131239 [Mycena vitilis]